MAESTGPPFGPAPPPANDRRIHLRILSPGHGVAESIDIRDVPLNISVETLKQRITLVAPSHPPVPHQRLIFAGRVLADNSAKLADALGDASRNSDSLTIHLITRGPAGASQSQPITRAATPSQVGSGNANAGAGNTHTGNAPIRVEARITPQSGPAQPGQPSQQPAQAPPHAPAPGPPPAQVPGLPGIPFNPFPIGFPGAQFQGLPGMPMPQQAMPGGQQGDQNVTPSTGQDEGQRSQQGQHAGQNQHEQMLATMQNIIQQQHQVMHQAAHHAAVHQAQAGQFQQPPVVQRIHAQWRAGPGLQVQPGQPGGPPGFARHPHYTPGQFAVPPNLVTGEQGQRSHSQSWSANTAPSAPHGQPAEQQTPSQQHPQMQNPPVPQFRPAMLPPRLPPTYTNFPLTFNIPPSQHLAQNFANIQAQAQLLAAPQTLYLLSSPTGPHALIYNDSQPYTAQLPTPPTSQPAQAGDAPQPIAAAAPNQAPARQPPHPALAQAIQAMEAPLIPQPAANAAAPQNAEQDLLAPFQPLMAHFWLLFRILLFAYFFLGTDDGWRRPLVLSGIVLMFFGLRAMDAGGGVRRRVGEWWEGVVGLGPRRGQAGQAGGAGAEGAGQAGVQGQQDAGAEQQQLGPVRRRLRPLERAMALFVASLWPGVGENTIRARREREEEERRAREATEREEQARIEQARQAAEGEAQAGADAQAGVSERGGQGQQESEGGYPRNVPINIDSDAGASSATGASTGAEARPNSIAELEREVRERRRREEGDGEGQVNDQ
ncbi:hypothetical protein C1H76_3462 [Elsinoe australis]|uniref:Ubiquitin-like domain-containing protein n=1 Tax=Elsinoe australis TaxID=40998 RepID=A0A4U7B6H8_9PEZI|nr:hypothetical protein C1H76_3462 [Elsinoe australis]